MNDMTVSNQWARRPLDQRFLSVDELDAKVSARRLECREEPMALDACRLQATMAGGIEVLDTRGESFGKLNHWSFGQLCQRAKAPAGYLRTLPAELSTVALQWSLETHEAAADEGNDAKLLVRRNGDTYVSAVTSPTYGRIWDADVVRAVRDRVNLDEWKVPAASYQATDPRRATTLYASDRDIFMFLVNESSIDVQGESIKRGFYISNSEVGAATLEIACFTYDYVCDNRIIWGQKNFKSLKVRHTSGGPHRFVSQVAPQLAAYAQSATAEQAATIRAAKAREIAGTREGVLDWMKARGFSLPTARKAYERAESDIRGYNPRTVWGMVQGLTDAAHDVEHTDARVELETKAGLLLEEVSA